MLSGWDGSSEGILVPRRHLDIADRQFRLRSALMPLRMMPVSMGRISNDYGHSTLQIVRQVLKVDTLLPFLLDLQTLRECCPETYKLAIDSFKLNLEVEWLISVDHGEVGAVVANVDQASH